MRFFPSFNTFIEIGPLSIQWYALCILTGAAIAYFIGQYNFKKLRYSKEILSMLHTANEIQDVFDSDGFDIKSITTQVIL